VQQPNNPLSHAPLINCRKGIAASHKNETRKEELQRRFPTSHAMHGPSGVHSRLSRLEEASSNNVRVVVRCR
jgi:hypothetical protein